MICLIGPFLVKCNRLLIRHPALRCQKTYKILCIPIKKAPVIYTGALMVLQVGSTNYM